MLRWFHRAASALRSTRPLEKAELGHGRYEEVVASVGSNPTAAQLRELMSAAYQAKLYSECGLLVRAYELKGFPPHDFVSRTEALLAKREFVDLSPVVLGVLPRPVEARSSAKELTPDGLGGASGSQKTTGEVLRSATPTELWGGTVFDKVGSSSSELVAISATNDTIVKLLPINPCSLAISVAFECDDEVPARKAATISAFFYNASGAYVGGPSSFRASPRIGPYQYVPSRRGANIFETLIEAPQGAAFLFVRFMSWDCVIRVEGDASLNVQDWDTFSNSQWAFLLDRHGDRPRAGAWLNIVGDEWVEVQRLEQVAHASRAHAGGMKLEINLLTDEDHPYRDATSFFSKPFSSALDCIEFCLDREIPVSIRAKKNFLETIPSDVPIDRWSA